MSLERDLDELDALLPSGSDAVGDDGSASTPVTRVGPTAVAASAFDVDRALSASAAFVQRAMRPHGPVEVDLEHVVAFSTTMVEIDGEPVPAWADLSGVYPTADGRHLQVHCNFEHHARGVVERLGCAHDAEAVAAAIATHDAVELEQQLIDDGMIAAVVRTLDEWDAHPHAVATRGHPVIDVERIGDADPAVAPEQADDRSPIAGARVLDCSRVLAGPVAGQLFASHGADVIRLSAPHLPSVAVGVVSTGFGKRNAWADLRTDDGRAAMSSLLAETDVWIDAYRPGALAGHGFDLDRATELRPGIVVVQISGFDWVGPWAGRRGFDSIVQSTTGVRWAGGEWAVDADGSPFGRGPLGLPVQALDYATGFLAAGVGARLLAHQRRHGGSWLARLSLLRTRDWLVGFGGPTPFTPSALQVPGRVVDERDSEFGRVRAVTPFTGSWPGPPRPLGTSPPRWL